MVRDISESQITSNVRRRAILIMLALAAVIGLVMLANWYFSFKTVKLEPVKEGSITFARGTGHGDEILETIAKTDKQASVRVKEGKYLVIYEADGFARKSETVTISRGTTLKTPDLNYSDTRLSDILEQEQASAQNIIDQETNLPGYAVAYEKLYHHGEWYGAVLTPPEYNGKTSTQRIILQKKDGRWKLVAGPGIVLTVDDNPDVYPGAIYDINNH